MSEGEGETNTEKVVGTEQLLALIRDKNAKISKVASINGEIGERIKAAVENGHLHRKAFALVAQLDRMEEDRRADAIRSIRLYLDICEDKLWSEGEHVGDLADMAAQQSVGDAAAHVTENVKNLSGIRELTPEEKAFDDLTADKPSRRRGKRDSGLPGADAEGTHTAIN